MTSKNDFLISDEYKDESMIETFDFDELEKQLQSELEENLDELKFLEEEKDKIGNPDNLGNVILNVIWEQFTSQIGINEGKDFIKDNNGLTLDLRSDAHIQTTENFKDGKIATHNTKIDYQKRYDDWQSNFVKDENGQIVTHSTRSGKQSATLNKNARKPFDKGRPKGSSEKKTDMDHTISASEIIRDADANAHLTKEELITFANSDINLNELDSSLNRSKGDTSMSEWLNNPNSKGQKPKEIFNISNEDEKKLLEKDAKARQEYKRKKEEAVKKSIELGKQSQKEEAFRIGKKAVKAVIIQLISDLLKKIIIRLVKWFKSSKKSLETLLDSLKDAIHSFISEMKTHLINIGSTVFNTIATAIIGPIFRTVKKIWMLLKNSWKAIKDAINYIKSPENKGKPIDRLILEVGKIIIAGLTASGALLMGEVIEKGLMSIPIFAVEIPLIGSLANILGIFFGSVVSGITGAIAINIIERKIAKKYKSDNIKNKINKSNEIINIQHQIKNINEIKLENTKINAVNNIKERHATAANIMNESLKNIVYNCDDTESIQNTFDDIDNLLKELGEI